jgi:hypothetical protein
MSKFKKLNFFHFCERVIQDKSGANSYISDFDQIKVTKLDKNKTINELNVPFSFVVAICFSGEVGKYEIKLDIHDPDGESIVNTEKVKTDLTQRRVVVNWNVQSVIKKIGKYEAIVEIDEETFTFPLYVTESNE